MQTPRIQMPPTRRRLSSSNEDIPSKGLLYFSFTFSPSSTGRRIKSDCDAWQSFSMEASVCLPCDVPQKWFGLEPQQLCRRCSHSGRALGAFCPAPGSKALVASLSFTLRLLGLQLKPL